MNEQQLYQSFSVILEMLEARGYNISSVRESYSPLELSNIYANASPILIECSEDKTRKVKLFYFNHFQFKKHMKNFKFQEEDPLVLHILVVTEKINHTILKSSIVYKTHKLKCQLFYIGETMINISKHILVPKHEILSKKEEQKVLTEYMSTKTQLPWILKNDPMAKFMGLETGQIVKITNASPTNGIYVSYRTCI